MTVESEPSQVPGVYTPTAGHERAGVDLYRIPLGTGGSRFVRLNCLVYEAIKAWLEGRRPLDLYHAALQVYIPDARFGVEVTPIPDSHLDPRGVLFERPVGSRWLSGLRERCIRELFVVSGVSGILGAVDAPLRSGNAHPDRIRRVAARFPAAPVLVGVFFRRLTRRLSKHSERWAGVLRAVGGCVRRPATP